MRNLLATLALLAIVLAVGLYAAGWLKYHKDGSTATIEIKTEQIEDAAGRAVEDGRDLLDDVLEEHPVKEVEPAPVKPASPDDLEAPVTQTFVAVHQYA